MLFTGCEEKIETGPVDWFGDTFSSMEEDQKIGQLFCLTVDPIKYFLYPDYKETVNTVLKKYMFGAIYLAANIDTVKMETRIEFNGNKLHDELVSLQGIAEIPLVVAADFESGAWYWDSKATRFPYPLALSAVQSEDYAYRQGKITAVEAKAQGINWLFSPVVSLKLPDKKGLLTLQSLGSDPETVGSIATSFITGSQEVGIATCLKYFPNERYNSLLDASPDILDDIQRGVFARGIEAGALSVMGSPVGLEGAPPPGEGKGMIDVLRNYLGFEGILLSEFRASNDPMYALQEMDLLLDCIDDGITMFILPEVFESDIPLLDLMFNEALSGNIDITAVDREVTRILKTKRRLNVHKAKEMHSLRTMSGIGLPEYYQNSRDIADASITLLKNDDGILPVNFEEAYVVSISFLGEYTPQFSSIYDNVFNTVSHDDLSLSIFDIPDERIKHEAIRRSKEADIIICSFFVKPDNESGDMTLQPGIIDLMNRIRAVNKKIIVVSYYDPGIIRQLKGFPSYIAAYSPSQHSIEATLEIIMGKRGATGRLPIRLSDEFPLGHGIITASNEAQ